MIGGVARQAIYKSGSGSNSLVFEYTVIPGETDTTGGITAGTNKLTANGKSTWEDIAGNDLDRNAVVAASVNTLTVNAIAPELNTVTVGDTALTTGETTTVTFVFSESPIGFTLDHCHWSYSINLIVARFCNPCRCVTYCICPVSVNSDDIGSIKVNLIHMWLALMA
jgi:hypothetical protein